MYQYRNKQKMRPQKQCQKGGLKGRGREMAKERHGASTNWVEGNMKVIRETAGRPAFRSKDAIVQTQEGISRPVSPCRLVLGWKSAC